MRSRLTAMASAVALIMLASSASHAAGPGVTPKDLIIEPPTLIALGFEWNVDGDDNGNASVAVSYRKKGAKDWRGALPLVRRSSAEDYSARYGPPVPVADRPNLFVGSIFDLEPDSEYEARFVMSDPDGVSGEREKIVTARTRPEPMPSPGGQVFHVYPIDWKGPYQRPAFMGVMGALYGGRAAADHYNVWLPRAKAGDTILVHAGLYKDQRQFYGASSEEIPADGKIPADWECCGATFHGTNYITHSGTPEKPIVIKGAGDGEAIFDGDNNAAIFNVMGAANIYFEGLTFRNTQTAIQAGQKGVAGASGITVKHSKFENIGEGVHTDWAGSKNFYIADNVFIGKHKQDKLVTWNLVRGGRVHGAQMRKLGITKEDTRMTSQYAAKLYGSGHVFAYNRVTAFHDGVDFATYGIPQDWPKTPRDRMPVANDVYNNDISVVHDDCIEGDGNLYNMRILRNRCINAAGSAISTQGMAGGPTYIVRNVAYHIPGSFAALKTTGAPGIVAYNNTFLSAVRSSFGPSAHSDFRNNLIIAGFPDEAAFTFQFASGSPTADYNGYLAGAAAKGIVVQGAAAANADSDQPAKEVAYKTIADFAKASGQDKHSRSVDYKVFQNLKPADTENIIRVYQPETIDFRLAPRGAAIDSGVAIPGVTDGYKGRAPDLGAEESGLAPTHYGPRPMPK